MFNPQTGWKGKAKSEPISFRELTILTMIAQGSTYEEIAKALGVKHQTVKNNVYRLTKKLGAKNSVHALMLAIEIGMIKLEIISNEMDEELSPEVRRKVKEELDKEIEEFGKMTPEEQEIYMAEQNMKAIREKRK